MYNITMIVKYKILSFLFVCIALVSCIDDDLAVCIDDADEIPEMFTDGYSLNMVVTLDRMGGTRSGGYTSERGQELEVLESYIDPEKFRVLFFDRQERFLFESKSRWVKKIVPNKEENDYSEWFVAVPIYAYGNDESEDWNWDEIRRVLTGEDMQEDLDNYPNPKDPNYKYNYDEEVIKKVQNGELQHAFKIAILANRPNREWNMGINGRDGSTDMVWPKGHASEGKPSAPLVEKGWEIVNGPIWKSVHTRWGDPDKMKKVFDLHHCQYDPVYDGKNYNDREKRDKKSDTDIVEHVDYVQGQTPNGEPRFYTNYKVYSFAADVVKPGDGFEDKIGQPAMGATSTWVNWDYRDGEDNNNATKGVNNVRYFMPPTEEHPIPMYGMQNFNEIKNWVKGTPFNLSKVTSEQTDYEYRTISLLRSVVKLELVLKDKEADWVALVYPNIYARCEPMNVWDPTDAIWDESTDNDPHVSGFTPKGEDYCEWYDIRKYGAVTRNSDFEWHNPSYDDENIIKGSIQRYKERMSWFYGVWSELGPDGKKRWDKLEQSGPGYRSQDGGELPRFPQIFNSCVQRAGQVLCHDQYRAARLPYKLLTFPESDGQHYVVYTGERNINDPTNLMSMGTYTKGAPTICFWQVKVKGANTRYNIAFAYKEGQGNYKSYITDTGENPGSSTLGAGTDPRPAPNGNNQPNSYEQAVQFGQGSMPWPLLRNHVYKIKVTNVSATRSDGDGGLSIEPEHLYSKSINFDKARKEKAAKEKIINKEAVTEAIK